MSTKKRADDRLQRILDATFEGWWEWDLKTNETYHSPGWFRLLGYKETDFSSSVAMWLSLIHPDDRDRTIAQQQEYIRQNAAWEIEFRMRASNGQYRWILSRGKVTAWNRKSEATCVAGVHIDITDRKQLEQMREESRIRAELIHGIIRVSLSSINIYDFIGKRLLYSAGLVYQKLGYSEAEFMGLSENFFRQILHPDDWEKVKNHLAQLAQESNGDVLECLVRFRNKAGDYHSVLIKDSVFRRNRAGEVVQAIGSAVDVTDYLAAQRQLEENVKLLEDLSFRNSHAVRGPVATILGLTKVIKQEVHSTEFLLELIEYLDRSVTKLDAIIFDFGDRLSRRVSEHNSEGSSE